MYTYLLIIIIIIASVIKRQRCRGALQGKCNRSNLLQIIIIIIIIMWYYVNFLNSLWNISTKNRIIKIIIIT